MKMDNRVVSLEQKNIEIEIIEERKIKMSFEKISKQARPIHY